MSEFDQLVEQFGEVKYDPKNGEKQRERARKRWASPHSHSHRADNGQRVPFPEPEEEEEEEERKPGERLKPSSASACSAKFRAQVEFNALDESAEEIAAALVRAMSRDKLKQVCLDALRKAGFAINHVSDKAKRDRTKETARRSELRAKIRKQKAEGTYGQDKDALAPELCKSLGL